MPVSHCLLVRATFRFGGRGGGDNGNWDEGANRSFSGEFEWGAALHCGACIHKGMRFTETLESCLFNFVAEVQFLAYHQQDPI